MQCPRCPRAAGVGGRWGASRVPWLGQHSTQDSCPPFCSHNHTPFFHFLCFLQNHLTVGCPDFWCVLLVMTASFCPSDFHGTRLSTEIKTEWPYSPQEEAVGSRVTYRPVPLGGEHRRWTLWSSSRGPQADLRPQPQKTHPFHVGERQAWHKP